jgi:hypothetical protein
MTPSKLLILAIVSAALAFPAAASGHALAWRTIPSIDQGGPTGASGDVRCPARGCPRTCLANRLVTLARKEGSRSIVVGRDRTDADGDWLIPVALIAGEYHVTVTRKNVVNTRRHLHFCAFARSPRVPL